MQNITFSLKKDLPVLSFEVSLDILASESLNRLRDAVLLKAIRSGENKFGSSEL